MVLFSCALAVFSGASALVRGGSSGAAKHHHFAHHHRDIVNASQFAHSLRVCNAYPFEDGFTVSNNDDNITEDSGPLMYKQCRDFEAPLHAGDKLEFSMGETSAGTFSISDLPNNDAVLLLVIRRHDATSTAVAFSSHVYANILNAQLAVVDAFKGAQQSELRIEDHSGARTAREEGLRFDSVVAVNEGKYELSLVSGAHTPAAGTGKPGLRRSELVALNRRNYVALRVGLDDATYPEEVVVFPHSDEGLLGSSPTMSVAAAAVALFVVRV